MAVKTPSIKLDISESIPSHLPELNKIKQDLLIISQNCSLLTCSICQSQFEKAASFVQHVKHDHGINKEVFQDSKPDDRFRDKSSIAKRRTNICSDLHHNRISHSRSVVQISTETLHVSPEASEIVSKNDSDHKAEENLKKEEINRLVTELENKKQIESQL